MHAFNKLSTCINCFEELQGSESQNPFQKVAINGKINAIIALHGYEAHANTVLQVPVTGCALRSFIWGTVIFCQPLGLAEEERIRTEMEDVRAGCVPKAGEGHTACHQKQPFGDQIV